MFVVLPVSRAVLHVLTTSLPANLRVINLQDMNRYGLPPDMVEVGLLESRNPENRLSAKKTIVKLKKKDGQMWRAKNSLI